MPIDDARKFGDRGEEVEKQRVCPSCRMLISILASKCRYCGEEVGKPKDETRELTSEDLGGETVYHRAPSGSVMDALESFRVEETTSLQRAEPAPPKKKSLIKKKQAEPLTQSVKSSREELPELDQNSRNLADAVLSPSLTSRPSSIRKSYERSPKEKAIAIGAWVLGAVALIFAAIKGVDAYRDYTARKAEADRVVVINEAPGMIERNESPIAILEAAVDAVEKEPSSENRRIAEQSLVLVVEQIQNLLNPEQSDPAEPWSMEKISEATGLADRAATLYPNDSTARLKREADAEMGYYRMVLSGVTDGAAQFKLNFPQQKTISARRGDTIEDRFIVKGTGNSEARLQDVLRRDKLGRPRELTFEMGGTKPY